MKKSFFALFFSLWTINLAAAPTPAPVAPSPNSLVFANDPKILAAYNTGNTITVDAGIGDDAHATRGTAAPYATLAAAKTAATSGDQIQVRPGTYTVTDSILKDGVNWSFAVGAKVTRTTTGGGIVDDKGAAITSQISGNGQFAVTLPNTNSADIAVIRTTNRASRLTVTADSIVASGKGVSALEMLGGDCTVCARLIQGNQYGVGWSAGNCHVTASIIRSGYWGVWSGEVLDVVSVDGNGTPNAWKSSGDCWITADTIELIDNVGAGSGNTIPDTAIVVTLNDADPANLNYGALWVTAQTIRDASTVRPLAVAVSNRGAKLYIQSEKITGKIESLSGLTYLNSQKVSLVSARTPSTPVLLYCEGGTMRANVLQWEDGSVTISGGTHEIAGAFASTQGVTLSGGALRLHDCTVDTSGSTTTNPLTLSGGNATLQNCSFIAGAGRDSITAPSARIVKVLGGLSMNRSVNSYVFLDSSQSSVAINGGSALTPLLAEYRMDEPAGNLLRNTRSKAVAPTPLNAFQSIGQFDTIPDTSGYYPWNGNSAATLTERAGMDPFGGQRATRVQIPSGTSGFHGIGQVVTTVLNQPMTLSVYVKNNSATGADQVFRQVAYIGGEPNTFTSDITIKVSDGWKRISLTFTPTVYAGYNVYPITTGSADAPLDLLVYGAVMQQGATATDLANSSLDLEAFGAPARTSTGIDFSGGTKYAYMPLPAMAVEECTFHAVVRWPSANSAGSGFAFVGSESLADRDRIALEAQGANGFRWTVGDGDGVGAGIVAGNQIDTARARALTNIHDGQWHLLSGTYNGTSASMYLDGVLLSTSSLNGYAGAYVHRPLRLSSLRLSLRNATNTFPGEIGYVAVSPKTASDSAIMQQTLEIAGIVRGKGIVLTPNMSSLVVFEGDSLTQGNPWSDNVMSSITTVSQGYIEAVTSSTTLDGGNGNSLASRATDVANRLNRVTGRKVLVVFTGRNDVYASIAPATEVANIKAYCLMQRAAIPGVKILLCTLPGGTTSVSGGNGTGWNTFRNAVNSLVYSDSSYYDALIDFAADSTIGQDNTFDVHPAFTTGDKVHYSVAGGSELSRVATPVIQSVLN